MPFPIFIDHGTFFPPEHLLGNASLAIPDEL